MPYVERSDQIPEDDFEKIRARLMQQINSMSKADLKIAAQTEASFRLVLTDLFRSAARALGYTIGVVVGVFEDVGKGILDGLRVGFEEGRR